MRLGKTSTGATVNCDVAKLIDTRLLVQGSSGSGKSWMIRLLAERVSAHVPIVVLDLEGEFVTLREKVDLVIAGDGGEVDVDVRSAGMLARKLLELRLSAVVDLFDLTWPQRRAYVRAFLESMMAAPRELWGPRLVVLDEGHTFAPEGAPSEALGAVIDVASRGRKRGYCLCVATQRLSKLHKDVAAELRNVMIGQTTLDVDVKRGLDVLGMPVDMANKKQLRGLDHEFFAFGPALSHNGVELIRADAVKTTHPEGGARRDLQPPAPSRKIAAVLGELAKLPEKAEAEAKSLEEAKRQIADLKRQIGKPVVDEAATAKAVEKAVASALASAHKAAQVLERKIETYDGILNSIANSVADARQEHGNILKRASGLLALLGSPNNFGDKSAPEIKPAGAYSSPHNSTHKSHSQTTVASQPKAVKAVASSAQSYSGGDTTLGKGERVVLTAVAQYPEGVSREQLTVLTGYKRSTRDAYIKRLRASDLVTADGEIIATEAGVSALGDFEPLPTGKALREYWLQRLPPGEQAMLCMLIEAYPQTIDRDELSRISEYKRSSRDAYLKRLVARKLITVKPAPRASDMLFD